MHVGVLGPIEVHGDDGEPVQLGRRKQRALLAALVAARGSTVSLDRLVDHLWDEDPPPQAIGSLQAYVSNLRRLIEPDRPARAPATRLVSRPPGYALVVGAGELDADRFTTLLDEARSARDEDDLRRAEALLDEALRLWRGPAYGEFGTEPFALADAGRLDELRLIAIEDRFEVRLASGRHAAVVADADAFVTEHPLRERAWGLLMVALYRAGRQADALRAYQRARRHLADELGLEPGPALRALERDVLAQSPELDERFPIVDVAAGEVGTSADGDDRAGSDLGRGPEGGFGASGRDESDRATRRLVGRDVEIARLTGALDRARAGSGGVVVITGEAGVGKSALASTVTCSWDGAAGDVAVGVGRNPETRDAPGLWSWMNVLRGLGVDDLHRIQDGDDAAIAPAARRTWVVDRIVEVAATRPTIVVVEDVQWADGPSQHVLRLLADDAARMRLLIVVTRRVPADDEDPALLATMAHLTRADACDRIQLRPLGADDAIDLVRQIAGDVPSDVATKIHERASGNPFYVVELARLVAAEGPAAGDAVPATVSDVIRHRLARLPEQAVAVISIAAVLGADADPPLIADLAGLDLDQVHDLLELGVVVGLLTEDGLTGGRRFAHDLVRTAIEATLTPIRLARLHAATMDALLARHGDDPARIHSIARHALGAVPVIGPAAAVEHLIASGRAAHWALDLDGATAQYQAAADLVAADPKGDPQFPARLLLVRAQFRFLTGGRTGEVDEWFRLARRQFAGEGGEFEAATALTWGSYSALWGDLATTAEQAELLRGFDGAAADAATSAASYLDGYAGWVGDVASARRSLAASIRPNAFGVGTAIRRSLLAVLDVLADRPADVRHGAATAMLEAVDVRDGWTGRSPRGAAPEAGPWVAAWTGSLAATAVALVDDCGDDVRAIVATARSAGGGIPFTDLVIAACAEVADAIGGDRAALERIAEHRRALDAAGDGLFAIPLAIAELRCRAVHRVATGELRAAIAARIDRTGQFGWRPVVDRV